MDGQTYTACSGYDMDLPDQAPDIPKTDRAKKISGSMGCQWGLAHGSLKPEQPCKWEPLAATHGVVLKFKRPIQKRKAAILSGPFLLTESWRHKPGWDYQAHWHWVRVLTPSK